MNNSMLPPDTIFSSKQATNFEKGLVQHTVRNSFTTCVFGLGDPLKGRANSPLSVYTSQNSIETATDKNSPRKVPQKKRIKNGRLLAVIGSNGSCVTYRENGNPHFICTETGGFLCNKSGCVVRCWKWKELDMSQFDELSEILTIKLNEHIVLEYRDPSNVRLAFSCDKETVTLNLGCVRDNQSKIQELVSFLNIVFGQKKKLSCFYSFCQLICIKN